MKLPADRKTVTGVVVLVLSSYLLMFITGYYAGKKSSLDEFSESIKQDAFSDRVYASLYTFSEGQDQETQEAPVEQERALEIQEIPEKSSADIQKLYYAVLVGFGAKNSAHKYVEKLESRGVPAQVIDRTSTSSRGTKRTWYQVITQPASLEQTQEWVHRVSLADKLQGVVIKEHEQIP